MKGLALVSIFIFGALILTVAASSADAGVLTATGGSTQISSAGEAVLGQTTRSWDDDRDRDTGRTSRDATRVRQQSFGELIEIIRLLTGPENWGEVRVVTVDTRREDEYTDRW